MLAAVAFALVIQAPPPADLAKDLASPKRGVRVEALASASRLDPLPPEMVPALIGFAKLDAGAAMDPKPSNRAGKARPTSDFKLADDDTSLSRVKASPSDYVGRLFNISAAVEVASFYGYSWRDEGGEFFSLRFTGLGKGGESGHAYISRRIGGGLIDRIADAREEGAGLAIRLRVTIPAERFKEGQDEGHALSLLEVVDWQTGNDDLTGFGPWALEPTRRVMGILAKKAPQGPRVLAGLVASEAELGAPRTDLLVRVWAYASIRTDLDPAGQVEAASVLSGAADRIEKSRLANRAEILALISEAKAFKGPDPSPAAKPKPKPRPVDPEAKAAGLLKLGDNLAKAGKTSAAQGYYREVVEKYPNTKAAATARARLGK